MPSRFITVYYQSRPISKFISDDVIADQFTGTDDVIAQVHLYQKNLDIVKLTFPLLAP